MTVHVRESQVFVVPPRTPEIIVRCAEEDDVAAIVAIVAEHARQGHLLPRSADNIRATLSSWLVAEVDGAVACCRSIAGCASGRRSCAGWSMRRVGADFRKCSH